MDLEQMRKELEALRNGGSRRDQKSSSEGDVRYWRPTPGEHQIRFINLQDTNPNVTHGPIKEWHWHYRVGADGSDRGKTFLCNKRSFNEECPICELASSMWQAQEEFEKEGTPRPDLRQAAINMFAKNRYYANVLVRGEEEKGVQVYSFGKRVAQAAYEVFLDQDYNGKFLDVNDGFDFKIKYELEDPTDKRSAKTIIRPSAKPSPLADTAEEIEDIMSTAYDLDEIYTPSELTDIIAALDKYQSDDFEDLGVEKYQESAETAPADINPALAAAMAKLQG